MSTHARTREIAKNDSEHCPMKFRLKFTVTCEVESETQTVQVEFEGIIKAQSLPRVGEFIWVSVFSDVPAEDDLLVGEVHHDLIDGVLQPFVGCTLAGGTMLADQKWSIVDANRWIDNELVPRLKK